MLTCQLCGNASLSLVLQARALAAASAAALTRAQAYAPLPSTPERFIYLFCCLASDACRNEERAWVTLRAQRSAPPPAAAPAPPAHVQAVAPPVPRPVDDWGGGSTDWSGGSGGEGGGGGGGAGGEALAAELEALSHELSAAALASAATGGGRRAEQHRTDGAGAPPFAPVHAKQSRPPPSPYTLPEFYLAAVTEPSADAAPAGPGLGPAAVEAAEATMEALQAGGGGDGGAGGDDGMGWGGEAYESMVVRGVGKPRLRFQKRLARCPSQCVRYSAVQPLLPLLPSGEQPGGPGAGACGACGGPRRLEAQLMPPLIHFFGEGVETGGTSRIAEALSEWDWTTVLMSTCARGCDGGAGGGGVAWVREGLQLQSSEEGEALRKLLREDGGAVMVED